MRKALMMMAVLAITTGCGGGKEPRQPIEEAVEQGKADAELVLSTPANSMEREKALLGIRAKEQSMREAGYDDAADDYIQAAKETLGL